MWTARQATPATPTLAVRKPDIEEEFEINEPFLSMIQEMNFDGKITDDPIQHVESFLDICDLFNIRGASSDAIKLRLFPFSLSGEAKTCVKTLEPDSITIWEECRSKFLHRYFPQARMDKLKIEILTFRQNDETLTVAWDRFKRLIRMCPNHGLSKGELVQAFYKGLEHTYRS